MTSSSAVREALEQASTALYLAGEAGFKECRCTVRCTADGMKPNPVCERCRFDESGVWIDTLRAALAPPPASSENAAVEEALEVLRIRALDGGYSDYRSRDDRTAEVNGASATLLAALAAKEAEIERLSNLILERRKKHGAEVASWQKERGRFKAEARAKDKEIERLLGHYGHGPGVLINRIGELEDALAAAEARGFRAAVEWFDEEAYVKKECIAIARAEADRREGK